MKACVIIPAYNEAKKIGEVIRQIRKQGLEVVVIDDGSRDNTADIALANQAIAIRNLCNEGKGSSLVKGYNYALQRDYDAVISMDGDGQHVASEIPKFIDWANKSDCGIVIGNRMGQTGNMPFVRILTNKIMSLLVSAVAKQKIPDTQCGFRLIKRAVLEKLRFTTRKYETETEILIRCARSGFQICSVPIKTVYDKEVSQINPFVDTLRFISYILREIWILKR